MLAAHIPRSVLVGMAAAASVLALIGGGVAAGGVTSAPQSPPLALASEASAAPVETSTTTSSTTSSTTTSTSTSTTTTSTTLKPKPVVTTVPATAPKATVPPTTAAPAPAPPPAERPSWGNSPEQRCASALQWVSSHGLNLPAGWGYRCPGKAIVNGAEKWGMACWNCEGTGSWIAVDIGRIGASDATLRYVVAHEICHAIDYMTLGASSELGADLCAATHGAARP